MNNTNSLIKFYNLLSAFYGPQNWWPAETPFEVIIGAILTQNTSWTNVEKAIKNLRKENLLSPEKLRDISYLQLSEIIRPSGYYRIKAQRIKAFVNFFYENYKGNLELLKEQKIEKIRFQLLSIKGIGKETADSILLYALEKPIFVVDIYTKRLLSRHQILNFKASYEEFQALFHDQITPDVQIYNEYHALIVKVGKDFCKATPICKGCPLENIS
ncbi:MAG: endonuclease III domain-containing protein [Thermodesulfovibrionales bacterium]|nr:endonuclease III domain-containing protein [Thermodesulfovibrionales bacterium]